MSLRIRRGTEAQRSSIVFDAGEVIYTTDTKRLYVGDGVTSGGTDPAQNLAGNGLNYNSSTKHFDVVLTPFTTDGLAEGSNNKYFTTQRSQDAFGALVANGTFSGVTVQYDSVNHALNISVAADYDAVQNDPAPKLGGNLNLNGYNITGTTGAISISGAITGGTISATTGLGANLSLNGKNLTGTGNINITGSVTATSFGTINTTGTLLGTQNNGGLPLATFFATTSGSQNSYITVELCRGTNAAPSAVVIGDGLSGMDLFGYDGSAFSRSVAYGGAVDSNGTVSSGIVPGKFLAVVQSSAAGAVSGSYQILSFNSLGVLTAPTVSYSLEVISPNYVSVATTSAYTLSSTQTDNLLLVGTTGLTATINMPVGPVDGQVCRFAVSANTVTLATGSGTVSPSFAGSVNAGTAFRYVYRASATTWYKI